MSSPEEQRALLERVIHALGPELLAQETLMLQALVARDAAVQLAVGTLTAADDHTATESLRALYGVTEPLRPRTVVPKKKRKNGKSE